MNNRLLSEFLSFNSSPNTQKSFVITRDFWGNFQFSCFKANDDFIESKISEEEVKENLALISNKNSNFLWLKVVNMVYLFMIIIGLLGIPIIALLSYLNHNNDLSAKSFVLLVVTLIASIAIVLSFIIALRLKILKSYTKKIRRILNELNLQKYMTRNLYWDVTDQFMHIKLHEIILNPTL